MNKPKCYAISRKKDYAEILIYGVIGEDFWSLNGGNTADGFAQEFSSLEKEFDNITVELILLVVMLWRVWLCII